MSVEEKAQTTAVADRIPTTQRYLVDEDIDFKALGREHGFDAADGRYVVDPEEAEREFGVDIARRLKTSADGRYILWPQPTSDPDDPQNCELSCVASSRYLHLVAHQGRVSQRIGNSSSSLQQPLCQTFRPLSVSPHSSLLPANSIQTWITSTTFRQTGLSCTLSPIDPLQN